MKILLINLNVGSAIEYIGNVIKKWVYDINKNSNEIKEYKLQTKESSTIEYLMEFSPDVIIINEVYYRIISPVFYYKKFKPDTKIVLFVHSQNSLIEPEIANLKNQYMMIYDLSLLSEKIFILDNKINNIKNIPNEKISIQFCPSEPEIFNNDIKWNNREKDFCFISNIYNTKLDKEFINKIVNTNIKIDVYGKLMEKFTNDDEYWEIYKRACKNNLNYMGELEQNKVGKIFNKYKYFIFPHSLKQGELFGMAIQQSIMCGTIPILLYDENKNNWAWWANDLFFSSDDIDSYINGLLWIKENKINEENNSIYISEEIKRRQNYEKFKKEFQNIFLKIT